jgi:biopolymer transport protein ExbB
VENYFERYIESGGIMMFFLIPCSFLAVWFIFQGWINLRRSRIVPKNIFSAVEKLRSTEDVKTFRDLLSHGRSSVARILNRIFEMKPAPGAGEIEDIAADLIDDEISLLYHKNNQLAVIYSVSPLLGLLGTILGMMNTFYVFAQSEDHSIGQLSNGINEALVTTMWGLVIAIPSFIMLYLFKQKLFNYEINVLPRLVKDIMRKIASIEDKAECSDKEVSDGSQEKA